MSEVTEESPAAELLPEVPLERTWAFWIHKKGHNGGVNYGTNMDQLGAFDTIEGFWRYVHQVPPPSEMFTNERGRQKYGDYEIDAVSVFRKGVRPEWEDAANMAGAEFSLKKQMGGGQLGTWFLSVIFGKALLR
jgi:translation initiation factor 4E